MKVKSRMKYFPFFVTLLLLIPFLSTGRSFRVDLLPDKGRNFGCGTCHISPGGGGARFGFNIKRLIGTY